MKKLYNMYEEVLTIEGVKNYNIVLNDTPFEDIKKDYQYLNDNTMYDKFYQVSFITSLMLTQEELLKVKIMLYASSNNKTSYNDLKVGI
jgi:hypothetical protein